MKYPERGTCFFCGNPARADYKSGTICDAHRTRGIDESSTWKDIEPVMKEDLRKLHEHRERLDREMKLDRYMQSLLRKHLRDGEDLEAMTIGLALEREGTTIQQVCEAFGIDAEEYTAGVEASMAEEQGLLQ
jgi:hypothetical protein